MDGPGAVARWAGDGDGLAVYRDGCFAYQFDGRAAWERYVKEFAARTQKPLTVTVSAGK